MRSPVLSRPSTNGHSADDQVPGKIIAQIDAQIDSWVDQIRSPQLDRIFYTLSSVADHSLLWHGLGILNALAMRDAGFAVRFSAMLGVESAITNGGIKTVFRRKRPDGVPSAGSLPFGMRRPITSSFPSGHATSAFAAATILAYKSKLAPVYFALAAAVAASRVYVKMHHASDVVAGSAMGIGFGKLGRLFVRR